jgi:hypothetical protein
VQPIQHAALEAYDVLHVNPRPPDERVALLPVQEAQEVALANEKRLHNRNLGRLQPLRDCRDVEAVDGIFDRAKALQEGDQDGSHDVATRVDALRPQTCAEIPPQVAPKGHGARKDEIGLHGQGGVLECRLNTLRQVDNGKGRRKVSVPGKRNASKTVGPLERSIRWAGTHVHAVHDELRGVPGVWLPEGRELGGA